MRLVIIESPYAGDIKTNVAYARRAVRDCLERGEAPIASHLLYTQEGILDDSIPEERELGIEAGLAWRYVAEATVVYTDRGITKGMKYGIDLAEKQGNPVEYRAFGNVNFLKPIDQTIEIVKNDAEVKFAEAIKASKYEQDTAAIPPPPYTISIYIKGFPGLFQYNVGTLEQAMNHFAAITTTGYRRINDRGQMEWYGTDMLHFIKIDGEGLETNYPDKFLRT